jgi:tetratricopeptide (TPR) repeat protein
MERAYEMEPYNTAVREELLELYSRSKWPEPDRLGVTRAALARFYCKGELYEQAVAELRQLLEAEPERIDLELLLVEALWHTDQRIEVNERCLRIVEELPYCLLANALLAHIRLQNVSSTG